MGWSSTMELVSERFLLHLGGRPGLVCHESGGTHEMLGGVSSSHDYPFGDPEQGEVEHCEEDRFLEGEK